jgi:hypothetical protein
MAIDFSAYKLGESNDTIKLDSSEDHRAALAAMFAQATRSVLILSHALDRRVYDDAALIETLLQLALRAPQCKVLVLVRDTNDIIHYGHRIIESMRRLPSRMQLRKVAPDFQTQTDEYVIVDEAGVLTRRLATRYEGSANFNARKEARDRTKTFMEIWRPSEPEPKLKHLSI